jgi:hypothetical protein
LIREEDGANDYAASMGTTAAVKMAQWAGAGAVAGAVGVSATSDTQNWQEIMMDSGSLNVDEFEEAPDLISEANYVPEQSMNLSKLLFDDDDMDAFQAESTAKNGPEGPSMVEMAAPVAISGGIQAMRAVYNRLRGNDDDLDDDTPGVQELMSQLPPSNPTAKAIPDGSRWAQMQQSMNQSLAQESTRGGAGFFMQSNA